MKEEPLVEALYGFGPYPIIAIHGGYDFLKNKEIEIVHKKNVDTTL